MEKIRYIQIMVARSAVSHKLRVGAWLQKNGISKQQYRSMLLVNGKSVLFTSLIKLCNACEVAPKNQDEFMHQFLLAKGVKKND